MGAESDFMQFMLERFGITIDNYVRDEKNNKIYLCTPELAAIESKFIQRKGMLAGKKESIFGMKPSLDFVLVFGYLAKRNFVRLNDEAITRLYYRERIKIEGADCDDGIIIVQNLDGRGAALAFKRGASLESLVPKERMMTRDA